ncbi:MAG: hypothetical protein AAF599_11820 [Bacteroidota bacterium]
MNIKTALLEEHSKAQALRISEYIGTSAERFDELMQCFFADDWRTNQCAAYTLNHVVDQQPALFAPYVEKSIENLKTPKHDAVKRNTLRIFQYYDVPEKLQGVLVDLAFNFLASPKEPIAVRVFSMNVIFNVAKKEPDLLHELKILIEEGMPNGSAGFKSRGRKILAYIDKVFPEEY